MLSLNDHEAVKLRVYHPSLIGAVFRPHPGSLERRSRTLSIQIG